jgi:hypothetical protein
LGKNKFRWFILILPDGKEILMYSRKGWVEFGNLAKYLSEDGIEGSYVRHISTLDAIKYMLRRV